MTIASEIQRIQTNITNAYTACNNKGATMPATQDSDNLATTINSIQVPPSSYTYNVTVVDPDGDVISIDGSKAVIKSLGTKAYIKTGITIQDLHDASSWEVGVRYRCLAWLMGSYPEYKNIFAAGDDNHNGYDFQGFNCIFQSNSLQLFMGSNGSWDIATPWYPNNSDLYKNGCEYIMKLSYDSINGYIWSIKNITFNETMFTTIYTSSNTTPIGQTNDGTTYYIWLGNNGYNYNNYETNGLMAEYDLADSYITVDGVTTYLAVAN